MTASRRQLPMPLFYCALWLSGRDTASPWGSLFNDSVAASTKRDVNLHNEYYHTVMLVCSAGEIGAARMRGRRGKLENEEMLILAN